MAKYALKDTGYVFRLIQRNTKKSHVPVSSINASSSGHISYREDTIVANVAATHRII